MKIEVLVAGMNQKDARLYKQCNIRTDAIIVNQCDEDNVESSDTPYGKVKLISTTERGLSNSRNMSLKNAVGDICIICDDDVVYVNDYVEIVSEAFEKLPDADIVVFNVERINNEGRNIEKPFKKVKRVPLYKTYSSVHIAFRRESIVNNGIIFDKRFGAGSGMYKMAEDAIFFMDCHKKALVSYVYPKVIAKVTMERSTWFAGYNENYFFDVGAYLSVVYPRLKHIMKWYYPIRLKKRTDLSVCKVIKSINNGFYGYQNKMNYEQFCRTRINV